MAVVQSEGALVAAHRPSTSSISKGITLYSGDFADYATLYREQPNVRLVTGFLARNIAQLGLHVFTVGDDDERARLPRDHGLSRLVRRPNPYVSRYRWVEALVLDLKIYDRFYGLKARNNATGQLRVFRIPPYMVEPAGDSWLFPEGYVVKGAKSKLELDRDQVVDLHGYNPTDGRVGLSPLESLRRILLEETAAGEWREQYWRGAARMSGVIERPPEAPNWSPTARERFRSDWQNVYSGSGVGVGATPILEEGMVWKEASFSPKDSEYLGARRLSREEVAAQYFVSPLFVGILDNANFSNVSEQHKHLYQDTLGPDLVSIEEDFELQILPEFGDLDEDRTYFEFNLAEKLKGTFEEQAKVLQTMTGAPIMTRNEGRSRLNLPRSTDPAADQLVTPLNVLIGGQASPRDSAPSGTAGRGRPLKALGRGRRAAKAVDDLPPDVQGWREKHVEVLEGFFDRQKAAVLSRVGAGQDVEEAWDDDRWDGELEADFFALSASMTDEIAAEVAERFGADYDDALPLEYLRESSRIAAENVNATTKAAAVDAHTEPGDDLSPAEAVTAVFAAALAVRVDEIAVSRATNVGNFARHEGAHQAGVPFKVWRVNAAQARSGHPADGETVDLDGVFSNGARWPGDASAGVDQTAGCTCSLEFTTEAP